MKKQEFETDALRRGPRHVVETEPKEANAPVNETLAAEETAAQMKNPEANAAQTQPEGEFANFDDQAEFGKEQALRDRKIAEDSALPPDPNAILEVRHLKKYFTLKKTILGKPLSELKAVDDVSFKIYPGETLGIVGESGRSEERR